MEHTLIARMWRGTVRAEHREAYVRYVQDTGVAEYVETPGNRAAYVLTRDLDDGTVEVSAFSLWDSWEAIAAFAGDDVDAMVLYPQDRAYLVGEPTLVHYDVHEAGPAEAAPEMAWTA